MTVLVKGRIASFEVESGNLVTIFPEANSNGVLVNVAEKPTVLSFLERCLFDVSFRMDLAHDTMPLAASLVPHTIALDTLFR